MFLPKNSILLTKFLEIKNRVLKDSLELIERFRVVDVTGKKYKTSNKIH